MPSGERRKQSIGSPIAFACKRTLSEQSMNVWLWHTIPLRLPGEASAVPSASDVLSTDKVRRRKTQSRHWHHCLCSENPKDRFGAIASHNG